MKFSNNRALLTATNDRKSESFNFKLSKFMQLLLNLLKNFPNVSSPYLSFDTPTFEMILEVIQSLLKFVAIFLLFYIVIFLNSYKGVIFYENNCYFEQ